MAPSRFNNTESSHRRPLTDASSKANALANLPARKPTTGQVKSIGNRISVPMANAAYVDIPNIAKPRNQANLVPSFANQRLTASSFSSRTTGFRPVKTHVGPWQLGSTVGRGGTCHVRMVRHATTGVIGVAKIIDKVTAEKVRARSLANLSQRMESGDFHFAAQLALPLGLEREIVIMRLLRHPNIVQLFDVWENSNEIYLIMENVEGGELFQHISEIGPMKESDAIFLFRQLVEALLYCHRMQIYHRDLKPENILIDKDLKKIKVIDFGMAAYQPAGDLLQTPCGSPHYAAPELLEGRAYDGSKADVWSLMVVLFVMLANEPPFNFGPGVPEESRLGDLYAQIKSCRVKLPSHLSKEAKDLFLRAFVRNPQQRISIVDLWKHPLLHKYDSVHGWQGRSMLQALGQAPETGNWVPLSPSTIDRQIFRNLRTLWHDVDEHTLVGKLCNNDVNAEKHFYAALTHYRDQRLDSHDYDIQRTGVPISESDYHHGSNKRSAKQKSSHARNGSQFSVFQAEHLKSKHSFFEEVVSELSYDPFRASSREPHGREKAKRKTPHSEDTRSLKKSSAARCQSLRVETLKTRSSTNAFVTGIKTARLDEPSVDRLSLSSRHTRAVSRHSTNSSHWLGNRSPIVIAKPSARHKRNVSFDHKYRRSVAMETTLSPDASLLEASLPTLSSKPQLMDMPSSPPMIPDRVQNLIVSNKMPLNSSTGPTPRARRNKDIEHAARKVSTELGEVCQKAFFASSISESSNRSSVSDPLGLATETPPTSLMSNGRSVTPKDLHHDRTILNRPLPLTPQLSQGLNTNSDKSETPHTYTERELSEMRQRLAQRYGKDGADNTAYFKAIIRQLDNLMQNDIMSSSPIHESLSGDLELSCTDLNPLQSIPEEGRFNTSDELLFPATTTGRATKFVMKHDARSFHPLQRVHDSRTIRIVEASSPPTTPTPLAPLKIRKSLIASGTSLPMAVNSEKHLTLQLKSPIVADNKQTIEDNTKAPTKMSWWRRVSNNTGNKDHDIKRTISSGSEWEDLDDRVSRRNARAAESTQHLIAVPSTPLRHAGDAQVSDVVEGRYYQQQRSAQLSGVSKTSSYLLHRSDLRSIENVELKRLGFLKGLFQKKPRPVYGIENDSSTNILGDHAVEQARCEAVTFSERCKESTDRNLLDRLLRFKPESKVLVMSHPRKISRVLLHRVLLQESSGGIVDVAPDGRNRNAFVARLDQDNKWRLKPVSFAIEFFSILRDGKQSQLTAVRFTQTNGSGGALRRLVHLLCQHLENRHLHTDTKENKEISKMIQTGRLSNKD